MMRQEGDRKGIQAEVTACTEALWLEGERGDKDNLQGLREH